MKVGDARVLLTGASGGIGSVMANKLVRSGAAVMLVGRSMQTLTALARELFLNISTPLKAVIADMNNSAVAHIHTGSFDAGIELYERTLKALPTAEIELLNPNPKITSELSSTPALNRFA